MNLSKNRVVNKYTCFCEVIFKFNKLHFLLVELVEENIQNDSNLSENEFSMGEIEATTGKVAEALTDEVSEGKFLILFIEPKLTMMYF